MSGGLCKREGTGVREGCTKNTEVRESPHVVTVTLRGTANEQTNRTPVVAEGLSQGRGLPVFAAYAIQKKTAVIRLSSMVLPQ